MSSPQTDIEAKSVLNAIDIKTNEANDSSSENHEDREQFLASFTAEEHDQIIRKVDRRFLLLIGFMYMLKNIDYMNAAVVKVLQVGQPRNILTELRMTSDEYNWASIQTGD